MQLVWIRAHKNDHTGTGDPSEFLVFSLTKIENEEQSTIIGIGVANYVFIFGDIGERLSQSKKSESSSD